MAFTRAHSHARGVALRSVARRHRAFDARARSIATRARASERDDATASVFFDDVIRAAACDAASTASDVEARSRRAMAMNAIEAAWASSVAALWRAGDAEAGIYDSVGVPNDEATPAENLFGLLFTGFSFWYFVRAVKRRSGKAREFRIANQLPREERERLDAERAARTKALSPMQSFIGGVTGIGISLVLYGFSVKVSETFDGKALPESETVRQISITVRTIVEGLAYLATFVYAANGVGLMALGAQKMMNYSAGVDLIDQANKEFEMNYLKKRADDEDAARRRAANDDVDDADAS